MLSIKKTIAKLINFATLQQVTFTYGKLFKRGGTVTLNIYNNLPATADSATMFTLPEGYRPRDAVNWVIFDTAGTKRGTLRINTNGTVTPVFGAFTTGTIRQTITYVVGGVRHRLYPTICKALGHLLGGGRYVEHKEGVGENVGRLYHKDNHCDCCKRKHGGQKRTEKVKQYREVNTRSERLLSKYRIHDGCDITNWIQTGKRPNKRYSPKSWIYRIFENPNGWKRCGITKHDSRNRLHRRNLCYIRSLIPERGWAVC